MRVKRISDRWYPAAAHRDDRYVAPASFNALARCFDTNQLNQRPNHFSKTLLFGQDINQTRFSTPPAT
jgi:hypothetical protein